MTGGDLEPTMLACESCIKNIQAIQKLEAEILRRPTSGFVNGLKSKIEELKAELSQSAEDENDYLKNEVERLNNGGVPVNKRYDDLHERIHDLQDTLNMRERGACYCWVCHTFVMHKDLINGTSCGVCHEVLYQVGQEFSSSSV